MSRTALALALLLACVAAPLAAEAQQPGRVYRLGFLSMRAGPPTTRSSTRSAPGCGIWATSRDATWSSRSGTRTATTNKLASLAAELIRLNPDVIIAQSGVASLASGTRRERFHRDGIQRDAVRQG